MSGEWFECVCQFFRAQSENLSTVLQSLGNQNTISDIGTGDTLVMPESQGMGITPMHVFMLFLAMVWAYMYVFSQNKAAETQKPKNITKDDDSTSGGGDPSAGSSGDPGSGGSGSSGGSGGVMGQ